MKTIFLPHPTFALSAAVELGAVPFAPTREKKKIRFGLESLFANNLIWRERCLMKKFSMAK